MLEDATTADLIHELSKRGEATIVMIAGTAASGLASEEDAQILYFNGSVAVCLGMTLVLQQHILAHRSERDLKPF